MWYWESNNSYVALSINSKQISVFVEFVDRKYINTREKITNNKSIVKVKSIILKSTHETETTSKNNLSPAITELL